MNNNISPILKVFTLSATIFLAIKYGLQGPDRPIVNILDWGASPPTQIKPIEENTIALIRNPSPKLPHRFHTQSRLFWIADKLRTTQAQKVHNPIFRNIQKAYSSTFLA